MRAHSRKATFENCSFYIPPKLMFEKDKNTQFGEYLFVYDSQENYLISFETDMPCFDLRHRENKNYLSEEYAYGPVKIKLCYPENRSKACGYMIYFHAELPAPNGDTYILPGQMKISAGNAWSDEAKNILLKLLRNVEVNDIESVC